MRTAVQRAVLVAAIALALGPRLSHGQPLPLPAQVNLDIDHDGVTDSAVLTENPATGAADLAIYLASGGGKPAPARKPTIVKKSLITGLLLRFEGSAAGSLIVMSGCGGCSNDYATTLTIVYRRGAFWVGGVTYAWDTRYDIGVCDIDFLAGTGLRSDGLNGRAKPIKGRFRPIRLADWSDATRPKGCD